MSERTDSTRSFNEEVDLAKIFEFIWKSRVFIAAGIVSGAVLAGVLAFVVREPRYVSRFLIEIDNSSLPAITDSKPLVEGIESVLQSNLSQSHILKAIYQSKDGKDFNSQDIVEQILLGELDTYVKNFDFLRKTDEKVRPRKSIERIFDVMEGPERSELISIIELPHSGFRDTLAINFIGALNEVIDAKNQEEVNVSERVAKSQIQSEKLSAKQAREVAQIGLEGSESEAIGIRSELAGIEFELSKAARKIPSIMDFLSSSRSAGLLNRLSTEKDIQTSISLNNINTEGVAERLEHVIQLISALQREGKLEMQAATDLHRRIIDLIVRFKKSQSDLSMLTELEGSFAKKLSDKTVLLAIDRSKVFLPRFKLNLAYYDALRNQANRQPGKVPLEMLTYSHSISKFVIFGSVIGGMISLSLAFIGLMVSRNGSTVPTSEKNPSPELFLRPENANAASGAKV